MGPFTLFRPQHLGNTRCVVFVGRGVLFLLVSMAPHLTKFELDFIFEEDETWQKEAPHEHMSICNGVCWHQRRSHRAVGVPRKGMEWGGGLPFV